MPNFDGEIIGLKQNNKRVKINEAGDFIEIPMNDSSYPKRFRDFINKIYEFSKELENKNDSISEDELFDIATDIHAKIGREIDSFFGKDMCNKIFGTNSPYIDSILEFFEKFSGLINEFFEDRLNKFSNIQNEYMEKINKRKKV